MNTADKVLMQLEEAQGAFVSGADIAAALGISRNSIWKAVSALKERGYPVEGVSRKGYRLAATPRLSAASISRHLKRDDVLVEFAEVIGSTNDRAKELAAQTGGPVLVAADRQSAGKGRRGRAFFSPAGCGAYFSLCVQPSFTLADVAYVTSFAAVCTARAIDEVFGVDAQVKWVNDIFVDGRKVCGILTEASVQPESGAVENVVIGIGVNVAEPPGGWPAELAGVAHALCGPGEADVDERRARLIALTARQLLDGLEDVPALPHLEEYRRRSLLDRRRVRVEEGRESYDAEVLGIADDLTLSVRLDDGSTRNLAYGEVSIPSSSL